MVQVGSALLTCLFIALQGCCFRSLQRKGVVRQMQLLLAGTSQADGRFPAGSLILIGWHSLAKVSGWMGNFCSCLSGGGFGAVELQEFIRMIPNGDGGEGSRGRTERKRERERTQVIVYIFRSVDSLNLQAKQPRCMAS